MNKPLIMPDFTTWKRETLEQFAREAYAKLAAIETAKPVPILREPLGCQKKVRIKEPSDCLACNGLGYGGITENNDLIRCSACGAVFE